MTPTLVHTVQTLPAPKIVKAYVRSPTNDSQQISLISFMTETHNHFLAHFDVAISLHLPVVKALH